MIGFQGHTETPKVHPMPITPARPDIADLSLRVFDRALHPELYSRTTTARFKSGEFNCVLSLGEAGHVVLISIDGESVCETLLDKSVSLPQRGQRLAFPLATEREAELTLAGAFRWDTRISFETFDRPGYVAAHERWEADARRAFISQEFDNGHRLLPPALSGMSLDLSGDFISLQAWHTFPDNLAVCRVQSRYERI